MSTAAGESSGKQLVITATAAAAFGAAVAVGLMKFVEHRNSKMLARTTTTRSLSSTTRRPSTTAIYEDNMKDSEMIDASQTGKLLFPHNHEEKMRRRIAARVAVEEDNYLPRESVTVRVPATSANMGPGCK